MKRTILGAALLLAGCHLTPVASTVPGYLTTPDGALLVNDSGQCWRTASWRPALAITQCDPEVVAAQQVVQEKEKKPKQEEAVQKPKEEENNDPFAGAEQAAAASENAAAGAAAAVGTFATGSAPAVGGKTPRFRDEVVFEPLVLNSDASFFFGADKLTPEGERAVVEIAGLLKARKAVDMRITVLGHTDRIGADTANLALSRRRAASVKAVLVREGIPAAAIETGGMGASKPLTQREDCPDNLVKCELIACLKPDRRVEIRTRGRVPSGMRQVQVEARHEVPVARPTPAPFEGVCEAG